MGMSQQADCLADYYFSKWNVFYQISGGILSGRVITILSQQHFAVHPSSIIAYQ